MAVEKSAPTTSPPATVDSPDADMRETASAVFLWAMGVGIAFVLLHLFCNYFELTTFAALNLILATGIGVLLFAFGTRAVLRISYLVMTGAGAIAATAFLGLMYYSINDWVKVTFKNPGFKHTQISAGAGDDAFLGGLIGDRYTFVALRSNLNHDEFDLEISELDDHNKISKIHPFTCIPIFVLKNYLGRGKTLEWQINSDFTELTMKAAPDVKFHDTCNRPPPVHGTFFPNFIGIGGAFAQGEEPPPPSIDEIIQSFEADSSQTRRNARAKFAERGLSMIRPMFAAMHANSDYRVQLGGAVSLAAFLRDNKPQAIQVEKLMTDSDFSLLIEQVASDDRTLRVYANEFAYDLGSSRLIAPALDKLAALGPAAASKRDNFASLVGVLTGAYPRADQAQKESVKKSLGALLGKGDENTDAMISRLLANL